MAEDLRADYPYPPIITGYYINSETGKAEPDPPPTGNGGSVNSGGTSVPGNASQQIPATAPIADFSYTVYENFSVGFVNKSLGSASAYLWRFGDGETSASANPLHQYRLAGTYGVVLIAANARGLSEKLIVVVVPAAPIATTVDFTYSPGALAVQFTDVSTKPGDRLWDFGDDTTSNEINPYHAYSTNGAYSVTLTIGGSSVTHQVIVDRGVQITWQDNSSNEDGFKIEHSLNGTDWTQIATTAAGVNTLLVTMNLHSVDPTALNYFRVRAYNSAGDSAYTNTITTQCEA